MPNVKKRLYIMEELLKKAIEFNQLDEDLKAIEILSSPTLQNNPEALHLLGSIYYLAEKEYSDIKKDIKKAIYFWKQAISLGSSQSAYELGRIYDLGSGVKMNKKRAEEYFNIGFQLKNDFFEFCGLELINLYIDKGEFEKSIGVCNKLIDENLLVGNCHHKLYKIYSDPSSNLFNQEMALIHLEKGSQNGNVPCSFKFADYLAEGIFIDINIEKAIKVLNKVLLNKENELFLDETKEKIELLSKKLEQ